jgi:hypothetical protein
MLGSSSTARSRRAGSGPLAMKHAGTTAFRMLIPTCYFHTRNVTCSFVHVASVQPGPLDALPRCDRRGVQRRRRLSASGPDQAVHGQYLHLRTAYLSGEKEATRAAPDMCLDLLGTCRTISICRVPASICHISRAAVGLTRAAVPRTHPDPLLCTFVCGLRPTVGDFCPLVHRLQ